MKNGLSRQNALSALLRRLRYSLSARLLLLFVLTAGAIVVILSLTIGASIRHHFQRNIRPHIEQYFHYLRADIGNPPDVEKAKALTRQVGLDIYIRGPQTNWSSSPAGLDLAGLDFHEHRHRGGLFAVDEEDGQYVLKTKAGAHDVYFVVKPRRRADRRIGLTAIIAMLGTLLFCYIAIRWLFRPVRDIQRGVRRIGHGELDFRIRVRRPDELGDLAASINAMAEQIEKMLDAKRQLLLAISHELRSPITRARVSIELLEDSPSRQALAEDMREMETLIGELLETERLNTRHSALNKSPLSINDLVREVVAEYFTAQEPAIELALADEAPYLMLDAARIKLLIKNLLDNAIRHNRANAPPPRVSTALEYGAPNRLRLTVSDNGPGIDAAHIAHLTEPFYRADPSRQRKTGGYGLGLYLCKVIAEAHAGALVIESRPGQGTDVIVTIALAD